MTTEHHKANGEKHDHAAAGLFIEEVTGIIRSASGLAPDCIVPCGSYRRGKPQVGDIDLVLVMDGAAPYDRILEAIVSAGHRCEVVQKGSKQMSLVVDGEWLLELKRSAPDELGAFLLFATGSGKFNVAMRGHAKHHGMKLNRYGLTDRRNGAVIASKTEAEIFDALGLAFVPPARRQGEDSLWIIAPSREHVVQSDSSPLIAYTVTLGPRTACDCKGFTYRQTCKHVDRALAAAASAA